VGLALAERYYQHTFPNGLTLLCEKMPAVQSAAMTLQLSAGSAGDPKGQSGCATILSDLVLRGAGDRDTRQLSDHLDSLGLHRSSGVGVHHARFSCEAVASRVIKGLPAYADIVRRPQLPQSGFDAARDLALQSLEGLPDDPRQILLVKLRQVFLPAPFGRNPMGEIPDIKALTLKAAKADWKKRYQADGAILSVAGNVDFEPLRAEVEEYFGDFPANLLPPIVPKSPAHKNHHESHQGEQTHIGVAYPSVLETDPDYYVMRLAVEVLGGGMSGRLFTEIREKRGLCYSVWAGYTSLKEFAGIMAYVGTSNERAQASLDCLLQEIRRLSKGVTPEELDRAKIGLKANTIMDGESTGARAGAIAHDFFMRGRMRGLEEIKSEIDAVSLDRINEHLRKHEPNQFTIVTVGPAELKMSGD
jgi:predicted Zn-dependent peptidase